MKLLKFLLPLIALLSLSSVAHSQDELQPILLNLKINNQGAEVLSQEVWADVKKLSDNVLRFQFLKPLVIKLVDNAGEIQPPRILRFVDLELGVGILNGVRRVAKQGPVDVVSYRNIGMLHGDFFESLAEFGPEHFIQGQAELPELYRIEGVGLALTLGDLSSTGPSKPYSLHFEGRKVLGPEGTLDSSTHSSSKVFITMISMNDPDVRELLTETDKIRKARQGIKPASNIIQFPGRRSCNKDLSND